MSEMGFAHYNDYLKGDEDALEQLVRTYSDALIRYAYCYVQGSTAAEDIMEDTIVTLIMKQKRLNDGSSLRAYLYRIARNKSIDYLRRQKNHVPLQDVENILTSGDLESAYSMRARNEAVYVCMQALPEQYKEVLQLTYFEGLSLQSSGRIMHRSVKQMYNLHNRAKLALKELLIREGISYEDLQ